jgi:hypothetical protein
VIPSDRAHRTLEAAARVSRTLAEAGVPHALVGSMALAVHGYVRATRDVDLAVLVPPSPRLAELAGLLRARGFSVEVSPPAPDDDLGGVLTASGEDFDPVQLVNFWNPPKPAPGLVREAIESAAPPGSLPLPVVDAAHLVALKLATGARRDEVDVLDLLEARPDLPMEAVAEVCQRHGLGDALDRLLAAEGKGLDRI